MIVVWGAIFGAHLALLAGMAMGFPPAGLIGAVVTGALLGGWLAFMLYLAMVFVAGIFFGLTLGILLFANYNPNVALIAGCGLGLVGGFVALKLQKILLILSTALQGAFQSLLGLMFFTHDFDWLQWLQQPKQIPVLIEKNAWLLPATVVLAVAGVFAQFGTKDTGDAKKDRSNERRKRK